MPLAQELMALDDDLAPALSHRGLEPRSETASRGVRQTGSEEIPETAKVWDVGNGAEAANPWRAERLFRADRVEPGRQAASHRR